MKSFTLWPDLSRVPHDKQERVWDYVVAVLVFLTLMGIAYHAVHFLTDKIRTDERVKIMDSIAKLAQDCQHKSGYYVIDHKGLGDCKALLPRVQEFVNPMKASQ